MSERAGLVAVLERIKSQAQSGEFRVTQHAQQEMVEEEITLDEVLEAVSKSEIIEHYPEHRRGACCLLSGVTNQRRALHVVCTSEPPPLILITVYEPKPPNWITPQRRRSKP